jgi:hypothetical protein
MGWRSRPRTVTVGLLLDTIHATLAEPKGERPVRSAEETAPRVDEVAHRS